jgi:hypothetical protein
MRSPFVVSTAVSHKGLEKAGVGRLFPYVISETEYDRFKTVGRVSGSDGYCGHINSDGGEGFASMGVRRQPFGA